MATELKRSEYNPFRTPTVTPNPTGAGPSTTSPAISQLPPQPQPESHTRAATPPASTSRGPSPSGRGRSADDLAADLQGTTLEDNTPAEPPPAYTPSANPYDGEATVEYGPHRPFQPAPPAPPLPQQFTGMSMPQHPHFAGMSQPSPFMTPQPTGLPMTPHQTGGWTQYPGQGAPNNNALGHFGPPPRHPSVTTNNYPPPQVQVTPAPTGMSEFARDFYASSANDRVPSPAHSHGSSEGSAEPEHYERVGPTSSTPSSHSPSHRTSSRYAPPDGPPPSSNSPAFPPPPGPPPSHPSREASDSGDDWRPTESPTPGRPLLNKGRVLVYPQNYECKKCLNTGYKSFDPSHPCRRCWDKYGKQYSGAILYAPRTQQSQRPLPNLRPPHLHHRQARSQPSLASPPPSNLNRSQSTYQPYNQPNQPFDGPNQGYPARPLSTPFPGCGPGGFFNPNRPMGMPIPRFNSTRGLPPPGATVVNPGDARIGGRLCWRCDGTGTVSFLIFDIEQCPVCRGVGRTLQ
ncbi:uncharacterized protein FOMMEDRAFT_136190 [Fomitiporia mediterranea MF3/22]|uniref:uncharacterized protein n=1 Tax=Fomitiporia mediterranea (strain MF3/22) TaxID=694068 RepID=UPI000440957F|nr:uncharacterized protein FOMMEDRAFT_136190 [Fomitiporia mediterranea MF3/22]EJD00065.1 hypothetical protein FOMMEDRAFT_136190 [Fomitiporia mediterranea MF3/22]